MNYILCNFIGNELKGLNRKDGVNLININEEFNKGALVSNCYKVTKDGKINLEFVLDGEACEGEQIDFIGSLEYGENYDSAKDLANTDENPIILIGAKKIKVFENVPVHIKYIPVQGGIIFALIKGYIEVESPDGQMLPQARNCTVTVLGNEAIYTAKDLAEKNILKDIKSQVQYIDNVVSDCILSVSIKDGCKMQSLKFNKNNFVVLNEDVFKSEAEKRAKELERINKEKRIQAEKNAKINEMYRIRMAQEEAKKSESKQRAAKRSTKKAEVTTSTAEEGAMAFLNIVKGLGSEV